MSCPAGVIGLDDPSCPCGPAAGSSDGISSGGLINPSFLVARVHQLLLWTFPVLLEQSPGRAKSES